MLDRPFPSLAAIRAFEAAARLGSFTAAGRELGTSSASVSYHVRQLEAQIGVTLFRRRPHRVELTEGGAMIAAEATNAFAALRASFARAADMDEARLSLTTLPTFGTSWLTPRLGLFRAQHPDISVELDVSEAAEDLSAGRFDAAIRNGDGRWPGLRTIELFPSIFMPLCVPGLKDAATGIGDPGAPLEVPLLGRPDWWASWYRSLGFAEGPPASRFGTSFSAEHLDVAAALAGHGVVIASPILFSREIDSGRLVPAHTKVAAAGRSFWLAYPLSRQHSRKIVRFRDWLCAEAERARAEAAAFLECVASAT
ncbi:LysR substrate-binding domain-containing protein [Sphingomonas cannabina]|uniref:LysR substrate-binding domain-containing protein n=1 Tax=Sphingomonas cannabina TaxID=2899123 RepID=UPI001F30D6B7|nr:LysR substrate-binding domain-containing protein [Sphingomonas cannabina]UIJ46567.1 LysR substrate-binding domain-containing protein [Sphingomonas cannabina]